VFTVKTKQRLTNLCNLFRVLSDETRLTLLLTLRDQGERHVSDLCGKLKLPQPTVSHHLGLLRAGGLVRNRRKGKMVLYSINPVAYDQIGAALKTMAAN
jgi:DNA-binding transcriptional ArsR family regulator